LPYVILTSLLLRGPFCSKKDLDAAAKCIDGKGVIAWHALALEQPVDAIWTLNVGS
jgi:hypothetical protein